MADVRLIEIDRELSDSLQSDVSGFEAVYGCRLGDVDSYVREVVDQGLLMSENSPEDPLCRIYLAADSETGQLIGMCGTKGAGAPEEDGVAEIAYMTFPVFERQGYGTALVRALLATAASSSSLIRRLIAHTLPQASAATRILEKVGMRLAGPVPGAGSLTVWRWESDIVVPPH